MQQQLNAPVSQSDIQKCMVCNIHQTKQIQLVLILRQLINSLKQILDNKEMLSQNITNRNAFGDLLKCVFSQKEAFINCQLICEHQSIKSYVCSRFECNQEQLNKAAQVRRLEIAKRIYELQLINMIAKKSIDTIYHRVDSEAKSEKLKNMGTKNERPQLIVFPAIEPQKVEQIEYQEYKQVKIEQPQRQQQNIFLNSNCPSFQFNMNNQQGCFPEGFPFLFGNQFHGFY